MKCTIKNTTIYAENEIIDTGFITWNDGKIIKIGPMTEFTADENVSEICGQGKVIIPGMIDIHIHGAGGSDVMDGTKEALKVISTSLPCEGTTSFLATTMTQKTDTIKSVLTNIKEHMEEQMEGVMAEVIGIHLEGPFINEENAGAQPKKYVIPPDIKLFQEFQRCSGNNIKIVTFAPEQAESETFIKMLTENNVIPSIGHSGANTEEAELAMSLGAKHVTHLYNGLTPLHHREAGIIGASFLNDDQYVELIVDGLHISPYIVNLTYKIKGVDRILLITDSMRAKYLSDGTYELGGQAVNVINGEARLVDGGNLAGSTLMMDQGIRNMINYTGCSLLEIVKMTAVNQAKRLNIFGHKGSLKVGKDADIVILDSDYQVVTTVCRGKIAYEKSSILSF